MSYFSEQDFVNITKAIATGARSVHIRDRSVTYHSLEEMLKLRKIIAADLGKVVGNTLPHTILIASSDGRGPNRDESDSFDQHEYP